MVRISDNEVVTGNKAKRLSSVNHAKNTIISFIIISTTPASKKASNLVYFQRNGKETNVALVHKKSDEQLLKYYRLASW